MAIQSTIRAFQSILPSYDFEKSQTFSEEFAIQRYKKKMETPIVGKEKELSKLAWEEFLSFDGGLPNKILLPDGTWYRARALIHKWIEGYCDSSEIDFPAGSSVVATRGHNSIESWLCQHKWTVTTECFDEFYSIVRTHKALKRAFRKKYNRWFLNGGFDLTRKESDRFLWSRLKCPEKITRWKLERVVTIVRGSRFSTVPKNNDSARPINIEPVGNIFSQRRIGVGLRNVLRRELGIDLLTLQDHHKDRITDNRIATIDLKNASDAVSTALVGFLFPKWFVKRLESSRSSLVYGLDGDYHSFRKISSMGNGFTFELMTVILTALCRSLDPTATVFGDDIIIDKSQADKLILCLEEVGFVVNETKSFVDGPFRESCGGNYHDDEGYIKSYDFTYPTTIADCCLIYNKVKYLSGYYASFASLEQRLLSHIPRALRGGPLESAPEKDHWSDSVTDLPAYFACGKQYGTPFRDSHLKEDYQISVAKRFVSWKFESRLRSPTRIDLCSRRNWAKYEMYLSNGVCKDSIRGSGAWVQTHSFLLDNRVFHSYPRGTKRARSKE